MTAFLTSGTIGAGEGLLGQAYEDAAGHTYNPLVIQPMIVPSAGANVLKAIPRRTMDRGVRLSLHIKNMFATGHDAANRAAVRQRPPEAMNPVGLTLPEDKKLADKVTKSARMHA